MRALVSSVLVGLSFASLSIAQAQSGNYGRPLDTPENRASMMLRFSSACAAREAPPTARKLLATEIGSDAEAKAAKSLHAVGRKCYQAQWPEFSSTAVRNSVAEYFYRERYRMSRPSPLAGPPPASFGVVPAGATGSPAQEAAWSLAAIARCTVFVDPADAHQLVIGPSNVPEEDRRFALLKPALSKCVAPAQVAGLNARNLRGFVADALLTQIEANH